MADTDRYTQKRHLNPAAGDDLLRSELPILFRMPRAFRVLAQELLRALISHPEATRIVGRILIDFAKASLERQGNRAPTVH
ncbi:MAG: hypothetical protein OEU92_22110 [Alphaproteobacteria bacterium]|nr:hypothetical protein [Alphaproteobacteria bacterium]